MTTITQAYINALLADAAYVDLISGPLSNPINLDALSTRMTSIQAAYLDANFEIASSINTSDSPLLGSGFDAVVWRGKPSGEYAGKIFVSMRGTEVPPIAAGADLLADADLTFNYGASKQILDMINWWSRITTPVGEMARQLINPAAGVWLLTTPVEGTGELINGSKVTVNGHSLGGHLATAFSRIFGASVVVEGVSTFNSAGFNTLQANILFRAIQSVLDTGTNTYSNNQINYFAGNGINFTTNEWWFAQKGQRIGLYQEEGISLPNHFMYKLTDALALGAALEKLDSTFTFTKLNNVIQAGSNVMADSYEGILDALLKTLVAPNVAPTPVGDVSDSPPSRESYHEAIGGLLKTPAFTSLEGKLIIRVSDGNALKAAARNSFSALVALTDLSPISITGKDAAADVVLNFFLQQSRAADYAAWEADKSTAHPTTFTDQWLADRSAMLGYVILANTSDITGPMSVAGAQGMHYEDIASGKVIDIGLVNDVIEKQQVLFGSDGNDVDGKLTGKSKDDRIYGGAGDDILDGQGGNDYLEGGSGTDTYRFSGSWGKDTIVDAGGQGRLMFDGQTLSKVEGTGDGRWRVEISPGVKLVLSLLKDSNSSTGEKLVITQEGSSDNSITVQHFDAVKARREEGYLGITFGDMQLAVNEAGMAPTAGQTGLNFWSSVTASLSNLLGKVSNLLEGTAKSFVVSLNQAAKAGDTLTLSVNGFAAQAILGDSKVDANGAVITLAEGQTSVSFALEAVDSLSADVSGQLSVSYQGQGFSVTSNTWGLNVKDAGEASKTFIGDQRAKLWGVDIQPDPVVNEDGSVTQDVIAPGDSRYNTYAWSKTEWAADGTLTGGVVQADFNDVTTGTDENDKIQGLGGNDALDGGAGNDQIEGGDGDDLIGGGAGSDNIQGGAGNDYILSAHGLAVPQRVGLNDDWNPPGSETVLLEGSTWGVYVRANGGVMTDGGGAGERDSAADVIDAGSGDDVVVASHGDDRIDGGSGSDQLEGGGGNDVIEGGSERDFLWGDGPNAAGTYSYTPPAQHGDDFLDGGEGDDQVIGQGGNDVVYGGAGNDYMHGDYVMSHSQYSGSWLLDGAYHGQDYLDGEDGNDVLYGGGRDDVMYGGAGNDIMEGDDTQNQLAGVHHGDDYLDGEEGDDSMAGGGGHDTLYGGSGKDLIYGDSVTDPVHGVAAEFHGNDYLDGEGDDDEIVGGGRDDTLYGGSGNDVLIGDGADVTGQHHGEDYLDGEDGDDQLLGGGGGDTLYGGAGNDVIYGDDDPALLAAEFHGDDYLDGGDGDDQLSGGGGDDILLGGAGNDLLTGGEGADYMDGGDGDDRYQAGAGDTVVDSVGTNSIALSDGDPVSVSASGSDLVLSYEEGSLTIVGALSGGISAINETSLGEWLRGRLMEGVNVSTSRDHQTVTGGSGSDELYAEHAYGVLVGGEGSDILVGGDAFVSLDGGAHNDILQTGDGGSEMSGGSGDDRLQAGSGADVLSGGSGNDEIDGGAGDDVLDGGSGDDVIYGGEGNDTLIAGAGRDMLQGGAGADTYQLGLGMGRVTAKDDSPELSTIQLDASGIQIDSLRALRRGNDLVLDVLGTTTSFSIQDYYSSTQTSWIIRDMDGETVTTQQLIDRSSPQWDVLRNDLYQDFKTWASSSIGLNHVSQGYVLQPDGRWLLSSERQFQNIFLNNYSRELSLYIRNGLSWDQFSSTLDWSRNDWSGVQSSIHDVTVVISDSSRTVADGEIFLASTTESVSYQAAWAGIQWSNFSTWVNETYSFAYESNGLEEHKSVVTEKWYVGQGVSLQTSAPGPGVSGPLPDYVSVQLAHNVLDYNLGQTTLTDGDHTVWADQYSAVIGGVGDNTIYGAGYAYGGSGDARLIGGEYLIAGDGDQYLQDGRVMVVGDGHTTVVGQASGSALFDPETGHWSGYAQPDTRILVSPGNSGVDLIINDDAARQDRNDDGWADAVQSIYAAYGIENIADSYVYGGKYYLSSPQLMRTSLASEDGEEGWEDDFSQSYFDSLEDAREAYAERNGDSSVPFEEMVTYIKPLPFLLKTPAPDSWGGDGVPSAYYGETGARTIILSGNSFEAMEEFYQSGALPRRIVSFGQGLLPDQIQLSWGTAESPLDGLTRVTLDLMWGTDQGIRIMIPRTGDPINGTVQEFEFSNGFSVSMADLIAMAPPAPSFDPDFVSFGAGDGQMVLNANEISGIRVSARNLQDVDIGIDGDDGVDLRLSINGGQDTLTLQSWFASSQYQADIILTLADGSFFTARELAAMALAGFENAGDDELEGTDGNDVLDGGYGNDWLEGEAGNDTLIGGAGDDEIEGEAGNDTIDAGAGDDWIEGDAGDDVLLGGGGDDYLNGGQGADTLEGGAGRDTYALRMDSGHDTVVDDASEGAVIHLGWSGDLDFDNLTAQRSQQDLVVSILGSDTSFRIKDYYASPSASWVIQNADDETITLQAVIDASLPQWGNLSAGLLSQFKLWAAGSIKADAVVDGYELQSDGTWFRSMPQYQSRHVGYNTLSEVLFERSTQHWGLVYDPNYSALDPVTGMMIHYYLDAAGGIRSVDYSSNTTSSWQQPNLAQIGTVLDGESTLTLSDADRTVTDSYIDLRSVSNTGNYRQVWQINQWTPGTAYSTSPGWYLQNTVLTPDSILPTEVLFNYVRTTYTNTQYSGAGVGLTYARPGSGATSGPLPAYTGHLQLDQAYTYNLGATYLSAGNHTVQADEYSIVIGTTGDISVRDAGYAYGGQGTAELIGGKVLIAGSGQQYLEGGETMVVGEGQTTVAGRFKVGLESPYEVPSWWNHKMRSDSRILVNPDNTGVDIIVSDSHEVADEDGDGEDDIESFYQAQGIFGLREAYERGGKYTLGGAITSQETRYFDTREEAYAYFLEYRSGDFDQIVRRVEPLKVLLHADWKRLNSTEEWDVVTPSSYYEEHPYALEKVSATSFSALEEFGNKGWMPQRIVVFGPGLVQSDLSYSWGELESTWDGQARVTLDLSWGDEQGLRIMIPRTLDPLNSTVQLFEFADGTMVTLSQLIALAPPAPNFDVGYLRLENGIGHVIATVEELQGISSPFSDLDQIEIRNSGEEGLDLTLSYNGGQDSVTIRNWYAGSRYQSNFPVVLEGGDVLFANELSALGVAHLANGGRDYFPEDDASDLLDGGLGNDIVYGGGGNDILIGGGGDDSLHDSTGSNILLGGAGDDYLTANFGPAFMVGGRGWDYSAGAGAAAVVAYNVGDDADVVFARNDLTLSLGGGLGIEDLQVYRTSSGFILSMSDTDSIRLTDYPANGQISIKLQLIGEDVRVYDLAGALADFLGAGGDTAARPLGDYLSAHLLMVSSTEAIGGRLAYEYAMAGNLNALSAAEMQAILAESGFGSTAQDITTEHAPAVNLQVTDFSILQPQAFSHQFAVDTFIDMDAGDVLTWDLAQADGQPLPAWLTFDAASRTLSGIPANQDAGELALRLSVVDGTGLSASQDFTLTVHETAGVSVVGTTGADTLLGGAGDDSIDGGLGADRMTGGDGDDHYIVDNVRDVVVEEAGHGIDRVDAFVSYTAHVHVETIALLGDANINAKGNGLDNQLYGNSGSNRLDGGAGADQLLGGLGNDVYVVDEAGDAVVELADEGTDTVQSLVDYTLGIHVENLTLTGTAAINGTGNELNNVIAGNIAGNTLRGLGGNDTLRGGLEADVLEGGEGNDRLDGGAGADLMVGGMGNDVYVLDETGDVVIELADEGTDTVQSLVDYTLGAHVENLTLTGTAAINGTGNELNNVIAGNIAGNTLRGLGGNDTLRGGLEADVLEGGEGNDRLDGGAGADLMVGGMGNDVYVLDETGDVVIELADEGTDTVQSLVDYTLGAHVENLTLTGTAAINGTGNELNNVITGNGAGNVLGGLGGNDTLRGGAEADTLLGGEGNDRLDGGAGADQLLGGLGNDVYVVDEAGDVVVELADEGTDTVQSLVNYTLGAHVENLTLTGAAVINGMGNELNNVITGNAAGNTLRGLGGNDTLRGGVGDDVLEGGEGNDRLDGGAGADQLAGGLGNDVYVVDDAGDMALELADEGTDTVQSLVDYTLGSHVENLTLTGTAVVNGTGNELNNVIAGNVAGNTLRGLGGNDTLRGGLEADVLEGGEGNDRLEGGLGGDTYLYSRGEGQDVVVDTDATEGVEDVLQFGNDISADQIWFKKSGNHLEISLIGTTDKVTVANWYLGEDRHIEMLQLANGQQLLDTQVQNLVQAMATFSPPAAGQTTLPESHAAALNTVIAANWQ
jgi:Ca2+-binding RTX toxin-like protein